MQQNIPLTSCGWLNFNQKLKNCLDLLKSYCLLTWRLFSWGRSLFHIEHYLYLLFFCNYCTLCLWPVITSDVRTANNRICASACSSGLLRPTSSRRSSGQPDLKVETPGSPMASVRALYSSIFLTNDFESGFVISRTRHGILQTTTIASVVIQRRRWLLAKLAQR